jgi:hypothetical protein
MKIGLLDVLSNRRLDIYMTTIYIYEIDEI